MNPEYMPLLRSFGMRAAALAVLVLGAAHANAQPVPSRMSPDDKASYAVGVARQRSPARPSPPDLRWQPGWAAAVSLIAFNRPGGRRRQSANAGLRQVLRPQ